MATGIIHSKDLHFVEVWLLLYIMFPSGRISTKLKSHSRIINVKLSFSLQKIQTRFCTQASQPADLWRGGWRMIDDRPGQKCILLHAPNVWHFYHMENFHVFPKFLHPEKLHVYNVETDFGKYPFNYLNILSVYTLQSSQTHKITDATSLNVEHLLQEKKSVFGRKSNVSG